MKSIIGWKSNGKKAPILWEKYEYQFPRSSPYDGFCWIFSCYGKLMGKPTHFPCNEVYQMGKKRSYFGKSMDTNFLGPSHTMGFVAFSRAIGN